MTTSFSLLDRVIDQEEPQQKRCQMLRTQKLRICDTVAGGDPATPIGCMKTLVNDGISYSTY